MAPNDPLPDHVEEAIDYTRENFQINKNREILSRLQTFLKGAGSCSGQNKEELRQWLSSLDYAKTYSQCPEDVFIMHLMAQTREPLRTILDLYLKKATNEGRVTTWTEIKEHISKECLSADEKEFLRDTVESTTQGIYEDIRTYVLRFREAVRRAYTEEEQKLPLITERLIKLLIRGFVNISVRERVILENPKTLEEVSEKAINIARAIHMAQNSALLGTSNTNNLGHTTQLLHEPMELGETGSSGINKLDSEMNKLKIKPEVHFTPRTSRRDNFKRGNSRERSRERHFTRKSTPSRVASIERQPKCHFCQKPGHVLKNCHEKLKQENRCFKCHKVGHKTDTCWSKNHLEGSSQQENFQRTR